MTCTEIWQADVANFVRSCVGGGPGELWHHRLRHVDVRSICALESMRRSMNLNKTSCLTATLICEACMEGKLYAVKRDNDVERQSPKPLEIVHKSVCGLTRNAYVKGAKYFCYFH